MSNIYDFLLMMNFVITEDNFSRSDFLATLSLGDAHPVDPPIPQDLLDCCAKLRTRAEGEGVTTASSEATAALRQLVDVSVDLEASLRQVDEAMTEDEAVSSYTTQIFSSMIAFYNQNMKRE